MARFLLKFTGRILLVLVVIAGLLWIAFNWPVRGKNEQMPFHISFSQLYANSLGLDWKEVYQEILTDLRPQKIRIAAYWTEIEKERGGYNWDDLDWMIEQAGESGTEVTLAFGIKVPRWPECFIPEFYLDDKEMREEALLKYEKLLLGYSNEEFDLEQLNESEVRL